jgi:hypothetical protein
MIINLITLFLVLKLVNDAIVYYMYLSNEAYEVETSEWLCCISNCEKSLKL